MTWWKAAQAKENPAPVDLERVGQVLSAQGFDMNQAADQEVLGAHFDDILVTFRLDAQGRFLTVSGTESVPFSDPQYLGFMAGAANTWNTSTFFGTAYLGTSLGERGQQLDLTVDHVTDCAPGLTTAQLCDTLEMGITVCVEGVRTLLGQYENATNPPAEA